MRKTEEEPEYLWEHMVLNVGRKVELEQMLESKKEKAKSQQDQNVGGHEGQDVWTSNGLC